MTDAFTSVELPRRVVVVGGGSAGWMAAAALATVLKPPYGIHLVESEEIGTIGVGEATIPTIRLFNDLIGLDEADFVRSTQGTFKLGIEFLNWGAQGERYFHGFGGIGDEPLSPLGFEQYWLRMRALGRAGPLDAYCINNAAALANRFGIPSAVQGDNPLRNFGYAYHFDAALYARRLRALAELRGVKRVEGRVVEVILDQAPGSRHGEVRAVRTHRGELIGGDLFIDCSGFAALLIEGALHTGFEDWNHWLPCDRALALPSDPVGPLTPFTRATAHKAGWQWRIPLQHRTGNGHVYCSRHISDDEAAAVLLRHVDGQALAEPRLIRFTTGMRRQAWNRNVVALGLAGGFVEPLESTSLHLTQMAIAQLMQFFPHRGFVPEHVAEYNRQSRLRYEAVRDFVILHYHLNQRSDSAFWRDCAHMNVPDRLRERMALYSATGRLVNADEDLFKEQSWMQVMEGQNLRPLSCQAPTALQDDDCTERYLRKVAGDIAARVAGMPEHADYIRRSKGLASAPRS